MTVNSAGNAVSWDDYYPFGTVMPGRSQISSADNRYKFTGKERDTETNYDYFGARYYDSRFGRWLQVDPLADKYPEWNTYNYCFNNPLVIIDLDGRDSIYFIDQSKQPKDDYKKANYTADVYVEINGPYKGSTFPDSKKNEDETEYNTIKEGEHNFNNFSGHKGGKQKGLNIVQDKDKKGDKNRQYIPGTDPNGKDKEMSHVNIHTGYKTRRFSQGCPTISPEDWDEFSNNFDWSGRSGNTDSSKGKVYIIRDKSKIPKHLKN